MTTLQKLKICGIRSFGCDKDDAQTIEFQRPLTLIVGGNGCGKSTIIECLRFLTAQKDPAGRGTFVHDPHLTNKAQVKAAIKLGVTDSKGSQFVLYRSLQATRTKKNISTKSLDACISRINPVTKEPIGSVSNRCIDYGAETIRIFGVSKAILENVIFCTQEDSHWPLETDQKLKEKFDQIFDSDKYNKCVNKVRDTRKKMIDDSKRSETELKYLKENKTEAQDKKRRFERTKVQIDDCNSQLKDLDKSMVNVDNKLKDIYEKEINISKALAVKESKKTEYKSAETHKRELKSHIEVEFQGTDEELTNEIKNFKMIASEKREEISKIEEKVSSITRREANLNKEMMGEQGKLGQLLKEDELHKEQLIDRNNRLEKLASDLEIEGRSSSISKGDIEIFLSDIKSVVKRKKENFELLRQKLAKEEQDFQIRIDDLREKSMMMNNDVRNKEKALQDNRNEITKLKEELIEIERSATNLSRIEVKLSTATKSIEELQKNLNIEELKSEIDKSKIKQKQLEENLSKVESEVQILQQLASVVAELEVQSELKATKQTDIKRLLNKHEECLTNLLGYLPQSGFKMAVQDNCDKLRRRIKELTITQNKKEKELTELEMNRKYLKEQLRLKEETLRNSEEEIYEECGSDDYEEKVISLRNTLEELLDSKGALSSSQFMYGRYIQALRKEEPCCPLCHRNFDRQDDAQTLVDELTRKVNQVPDLLKDNQSRLDDKQSKYNKLLTLKPTNERISALKNLEIPKLRTDLEKTEINLKKVRKELDDLGNEILAPQTDEAISNSLQGDMSLLDQLQTELKKLEREVERLQNKLGGREVSKGSLEKALSDQDTTRKTLKSTRDQIDRLQTTLNLHNEKLQLLQSNKNSLMEEKNKIQQGVGQRKQLEDRFAAIQAEEMVLMEELDHLQEKLGPVKKSLADLTAQRQSFKEENSSKIEKARTSVAKIERQLENIESMQKQIKAVENKDIPKQIEALRNSLKRFENDLELLREKKLQAAKEVDEIKRNISNQQTRERELDDNLRFRAKIKECEQLRREIMELEGKFKDLDCNALLQEKRTWKQEEEKIIKEKARIQGRLGELEAQAEQLEKELNNKMYRTAVEDYHKEYLKYEVLRSAAEDLGRYSVAMEFAMMRYHTIKMNRVNSFIREYWRKIYHGNDIDYIEIMTDEISQLSEKRRNYNYRLVQVKNDVSLEMRNRCSAGQKMLASLIIRMALAETFSNNCGILTLDEPTTNLDRKNIKNLARTLNEILETKQSLSNSNFQLIVITHDEEFVHALMELDALNECVKVDRNYSGKSVIRKARIFNTLEGIMNENNPRETDYD